MRMHCGMVRSRRTASTSAGFMTSHLSLGWSAAYCYRAQASGKSPRILVLDNHDDFGGHAKRNEFQIGGRTLLRNGGTLEIDSPRPYDAAAAGLIKELGIDVAALRKKV